MTSSPPPSLNDSSANVTIRRDGIRPYLENGSGSPGAFVADGFLVVAHGLARIHGGEIDVALRQIVFQAAEATVVVKSDTPDSVVRFYADVGLPASCDQLRVYRAALEGNLLRVSQPITTGLHVESARVVATCAIAPQDFADADALDAGALGVLDQLLECVHDMRARFSFFSA